MPKIADFYAELGLKKNKFDAGMKDAGQAPSKLGSAFAGLGGQIAAAFSVGAIIGFSRAVINVTAEFQKFQAVLTNTLGSSDLAAQYLRQITEFAAKTPFSVQQLTDAFVKLANQGFIPSQDEMTKLGDLASSTGKSFDQLAEAILDATTGEFERLKEFGIKASASGDKVAFSFKGITTEVDNTSSSIRKYILGLGEAEGVTGAMAAISETLGGKISNLGDSWDQFMLSIGNSEGPLTSFIDLIGTKLNELTTIINDKATPAWKRWLALLNIGPYRGRILRAADAAQNEADQAADRAQWWAPPAFDYQSIIDGEKKLAKAAKEREKEREKAIEKAKDMAQALIYLQYDLVDASSNVGDNLFTFDPDHVDMSMFENMDIEPIPIPVDIEAFNTSMAEARQKTLNFIEEISNIFSDFMTDFVTTFARGIGDLITGENTLKGFFQSILNSIGEFITQMGEAMIAYGVGVIAFEMAFSNPYAAIAAGAALVAIGTMISNLASKGPDTSGMTGGGGGYNNPSYQNGVIGANGELILTTEVSGDNLLFILQRAENNRLRTRG